MATIEITIPTPCGNQTVKVPLPAIPLPAFPPPFPPPFPPKFRIPLPDCSLLKHLGSAPEPKEDSFP